MKPLELTLEPWALAVCQLRPADPVPAWCKGAFHAILHTPGEVTIVCDEAAVPPGVKVEKGWRCFGLKGPIPFGTTGILASIAVPLAEARIGIFVLSTFDTDYVMVAARDVDAATRALQAAGHTVAR